MTAGRRSRGVRHLGRATDRRPWPARKLVDDYAQFTQTGQDSASGIVDAAAPNSPDSHRAVRGLTSRPRVSLRAFLRFPVCPPGSSPSSAFLRFPFVRRSPVWSLRPLLGSGSPSVSLRVPFPLRNSHVSAAAGRFRRRWSRAAGTKVTSSVTASPDRAIGPHERWAAAGHDGMPPQNRLLRAAASAGHRRTRTAQVRRISRAGRPVSCDRLSQNGGAWGGKSGAAAASDTASSGFRGRHPHLDPRPLPKFEHHDALRGPTLIAAARSQMTASSPRGTFSQAELAGELVLAQHQVAAGGLKHRHPVVRRLTARGQPAV